MPKLSHAELFRRWRRDHKHISQREFARALGVSPRTVANIEAGHTQPSWHTLNKFAVLKARHEAEHGRKTGSTPIKW